MNSNFCELVDWLILIACQPIQGYFIRGWGITFIVHLCLQFFELFLKSFKQTVVDITYLYLMQIICTLLNDIKYSYLIQIICTKLYGFKYSYLILIII